MTIDSRVGTEFAGYRIESVLGRGGMGVVYLAQDARLGRKVALKLLPPELGLDAKFRERFIRESQMAAQLEHPNILPVYEAGEADGQLFIAMRYVRGADLGSILAGEGPLSSERAISVVGDVAAALDEAHGEGLVHRDVKPANILLAPSRGAGSPELAYLTDFGVTRRTTSQSGLTKTGQFMGTADYAAPEQIEGKSVDPRADVYSLGCVLYHCLTGEPPFVRDSEVATMYAHLKDRPPKPSAKRPDLPQGLDDVVATAMAKAPGQRYRSAGDLAEAAKATVSGRPAPGRPTRSRRRRTLVTVGGVVLVALAVVAVAILSGGEGTVKTPTSSPGGGQVPGVLRIDPTSGRILAAIDLRVQPTANSIAFGDGFLWILERAGLRKVNAAGTLVGNPIEVGPPLECPTLGGLACAATIAAGEGSAWVIATASTLTGVSDSVLAKVDPLTNRIETFPLRGVAPGGAFAGVPLATGEGWVWTIARNPAALVRIDPANPRNVDRFTLSAPGEGIGVEFGSVWVRHNTGIRSFLTRLDPATGRVLETISVPGSADGFGFGAGGVWVSDSSNDQVVEIDPTSNSISNQFEVGRDPQAVVVDDAGDVWVNLTGEGRGPEAGVLVKVDAVTGEVVSRIPLGGTGGPAGVLTRRTGLAFGFGSVWVG